MSDDVKDSHSDRQTGQLARDHHDLFFPVWSGAEAQQSVRVSGGISLHPPHPHPLRSSTTNTYLKVWPAVHPLTYRGSSRGLSHSNYHRRRQKHQGFHKCCNRLLVTQRLWLFMETMAEGGLSLCRFTRFLVDVTPTISWIGSI